MASLNGRLGTIIVYNSSHSIKLEEIINDLKAILLAYSILRSRLLKFAAGLIGVHAHRFPCV